MAKIHDLPEELMWLIIIQLDHQPPSLLRMNDQPSVNLLFSDDQPLKNLSCVSQRWRRLALPILFKHMRLALSDLLPNGYKGTADQKAFLHLKSPSTWLPASKDFFRFIEAYQLKRHIFGLVVFTKLDVAEFSSSYLLDNVGSATNYTLTLVRYMWQQLLDLINPDRLVLFAPPRILGSLLSLFVDMSDAWSFNIECQVLELLRSTSTVSNPSRQVCNPNTLITSKSSVPDFTKSHMLVKMCAWSSITYNEGSSLNAYGIYHYFEKTPPSVLLGEPRLLNPQLQKSALTTLELQQSHLPNLTRFSYTAIFPHFAHFSRILIELSTLSNLRELCLQLAPMAGSGLLDDSEKIGKGNLSLRDCWSEIERCYILVVDLIAAERLIPWIEFRSHDCAIHELSTELDGMFEQRALQWMKYEEGFWGKKSLN